MGNLFDFFEPIVYVDGSFDHNNQHYSVGGVIISENKTYYLSKVFENNKYKKSTSLAAELCGAEYIIKKCIEMGFEKIHLYYDCDAIKDLYFSNHKQKVSVCKKYHNFALDAKKKIEVIFHKVKGHSGDTYNTICDRLARYALLNYREFNWKDSKEIIEIKK